ASCSRRRRAERLAGGRSRQRQPRRQHEPPPPLAHASTYAYPANSATSTATVTGVSTAAATRSPFESSSFFHIAQVRQPVCGKLATSGSDAAAIAWSRRGFEARNMAALLAERIARAGPPAAARVG